MKALIINADDFGLTDGVSRGIVEALDSSIVRSTSVMLCAEGSGARLEGRRESLAGRVGIHLQLTDGVPCSEPPLVPTLTARDGMFPSRAREVSVAKIDLRREGVA